MARIAFLFLIVAVATINAAPSCDEHEVYDSCNSACQRTCTNPQPAVCVLSCVPGCACVEGYVRNAEHKCVLLQNC